MNTARYSATLPCPGTGPNVPQPSFFEMVKRNLHEHAENDTPSGVSVPLTWPGILAWAVGKNGPMALFVVSTWFLYQDNKVMQGQILEVTKTQIAVTQTVVASLVELKTSLVALADEARRAHHTSP